MQEINELKNLVIQSLEGNGVLGQIRAQIRASVFKIIEMQETNAKKNAGFFWENPLCQTIYDNPEGKVALELISDFLDFFKMDYTSSVFVHESNLREPSKRDELQKKLGIRGDGNKPVLFQLIASLQGGHQPSPNKENISIQNQAQDLSGTKPQNTINNTRGGISNFQEPSTDLKKNVNQPIDNLSLGGTKLAGKGNLPSLDAGSSGKVPPLTGTTTQDKPANVRNNLLNIEQPTKKPEPEVKKPVEQKKEEPYGAGKFKNPPAQEESEDEYDNEVFENVDEDLVEDLEEEDTKNIKKSMLQSSEDIIGASQSQGFDVSVDSLALEEYDYYEPAERAR